MISFKYLLFVLFTSLSVAATAQVSGCYASLANDTLTVANNRFVSHWKWNKGQITLLSTQEVASNETIAWNNEDSFFYLPQHPFFENDSLTIDTIGRTYAYPAHLRVSLLNQHQGLKVKHVLRIFSNTPALSYDYYLQYQTIAADGLSDTLSIDGTEGYYEKEGKEGGHLLTLNLPSPHWRMTGVSFQDRTDRNNTLVFEQEILPYRFDHYMKGNLLLATDLEEQRSFFILKEAPNQTSQLNYPAFDFAVSKQSIRVPFSGYPLEAISSDWIRGYTTTLGMGNPLYSLRTYLKNSTLYIAEDHEMVMMNTWGDRGRDERISESFILKELEAAATLGITHFQIDDGWQQGLTANSYDSSGALWDSWDVEDWQVNEQRFPNGLAKVIQSARKKNIQLGLWFHPSNYNSYAAWEQDADIITRIYEQTGIRYFKIDGVKVPDKASEVNLGKFFTRVKQQTNGEVFFNLDLTAGVRGGYFMYRNLGNLFLENRYTDWANYYPYQTLRNLWTLAKYYPPEMLQIEFLNNSRNQDAYANNDLFAPANYSMSYLFATTMAAQPLAWFEATGLPATAFTIAEETKGYTELQTDFHAGHIFPMGEAPSGRSWTGFQSIQENEGYFLVYREQHKNSSAAIKVDLPVGATLTMYPVLGDVTKEKQMVVVGKDQRVTFELPEVNTYAMYRYTVDEK